jgi:adenylate cyclase
MRLDVLQKRNLSNGVRITLAGVLISLIYPLFADGFSELIPFINAFLIGLLGGAFVAFCELELFQGRMIFRSFLSRVFLKSFVYFLAFVIAIPVIILMSESIYYGKGVREHFNSEIFQDFIFKDDFGIILIYALAFICIVIFVREMTLKLGQGVLWNYLTGKYHEPKLEKRIFMFIDLYSSTQAAEQMDGLTFHAYIDDFIKDVTDSILAFGGIIYRYVGDQIDITWHVSAGSKNVNCVRAYLAAQNAIYRKREKYLKKYGFIPRFITSMHCGEVVIGQLGDVKSQIVYLGDTIHEIGQIEKEFKHADLDAPILISDKLLEHLKVPALFDVVKIGTLDGMEKKINVFSLVEKRKRSK